MLDYVIRNAAVPGAANGGAVELGFSKGKIAAVEPKLQAFYSSLDDKQKHAFDTGGRVGGLFGWLNR